MDTLPTHTAPPRATPRPWRYVAALCAMALIGAVALLGPGANAPSESGESTARAFEATKLWLAGDKEGAKVPLRNAHHAPAAARYTHQPPPPRMRRSRHGHRQLPSSNAAAHSTSLSRCRHRPSRLVRRESRARRRATRSRRSSMPRPSTTSSRSGRRLIRGCEAPAVAPKPTPLTLLPRLCLRRIIR